MLHGLPFLQLGVLLLDFVLVLLGKNTNRVSNYILESEIKDYFLLLYFFYNVTISLIFCIFVLEETCPHVAAMLYKIEKAIRSGIAEQL